MDAKQLTLEGMGWRESEATYQRLPDRAKGKVTDMVWDAMRQHGRHLRAFCHGLEGHRGRVGWRRCDESHGRYGKQRAGSLPASRWCLGICRCRSSGPLHALLRSLLGGLAGEFTEYMLYLPLYHGVSELKIGGFFRGPRLLRRRYEKASRLSFMARRSRRAGALLVRECAMRRLLGRWLDREVINLGFSGSGKMEPIMAGSAGRA